SSSAVKDEVLLAPVPSSEDPWTHFSGRLVFSAVARRLDDSELKALANPPATLQTALYEENSKSWPLQTKQQAGYLAPQVPDLVPAGAPANLPEAKPLPAARSTLQQLNSSQWAIAANWRLLSNDDPGASLKPEDGARISTAAFAEQNWLPATVPGTVLTTLIDRGIYPDPYLGLNNLAIPESLNRHDYWYRTTFPAPHRTLGSRLFLQFAGINYTADVWFNGSKVGSIRGAFQRGDFEITKLMYQGSENVLAVRIAPPPHPGIPQEQSLAGGPGANGGAMLIDGPTFVATEGWDWIPAIRDRDTGIWQGVYLLEAGTVRLGDLQVVTHLPLPDISSADIEMNVPVHNSRGSVAHVTLGVDFEGVHLRLPFTVAPGDSVLRLLPAQYPQLHLLQPRLWWPNGYGSPELYHLKVALEDEHGKHQEERVLAFGVREVSYELSLFDHAGKLERVEVLTQEARALGFDPVDVRHEAMRETQSGWASSLNPKAEGSAAVRPVTNEPGMTDLVIKVNGVRIAVRGGNWGMDDARKRVERERLEPYFRLHQEANLNMVRNWVGQDTEETFFELADEYGMMVWNDFWASTQDYNAEPGDPALFLDNARDTVRRYRNHPSIVLWCGRNEGVPPPVLNEGLIRVLHEEDGTRFYSPSSNKINLRGSGPYNWKVPALYFSTLNRGFSVELGISSFPTREAFEQTVAKADLWPISDDWAYHDWHQASGGDTHELMRHVSLQFGPSQSLAEFESKLQMFNYVDHQAIFEGMYQHLWSPNSGRLIWMSHPAWPSTMWQMYSSDYDTQASFYAIKKANAPVHVQMDLSDGTILAVNTTQMLLPGMMVSASVYTLDNRLLLTTHQKAALPANDITRAFQLPLDVLFNKAPVLLVRLDLKDSGGKLNRSNFYWISKEESNMSALCGMEKVALSTNARQIRPLRKGEQSLEVRLANETRSPALMAKLTLVDDLGNRILPAYYGDNYISLLAGESSTVVIQIPSGSLKAATRMHVGVRGWNVVQQTVDVLP
ncbi:MAG: glycoside hydrolase family 2 protein, partial [Janthinobacterium lividum]